MYFARPKQVPIYHQNHCLLQDVIQYLCFILKSTKIQKSVDESAIDYKCHSLYSNSKTNQWQNRQVIFAFIDRITVSTILLHHWALYQSSINGAALIQNYFMKVEDGVEADNQRQQRLWKEMRLRQSRAKAWSLSEQRTYVRFLRENSDIMRTTQLRKKHRVFRMLSKLLQTRTPIQVKAHHQKYQERYRINSQIIEAIEKLINKTLSVAVEPSNTPKEKVEHHSSEHNTFYGEHSGVQKDSMVKVQPGDQIQYKCYLYPQGIQIDWHSVTTYSHSSK